MTQAQIPQAHMSQAKERILERLRAGRDAASFPMESEEEGDREWLKRQPPIADPAGRFIAEQEAVGGVVRRIGGWDALPQIVPSWLAEHGATSVMTGSDPRLEGLREALKEQGRVSLHRYDRPMEEQKEELFNVDCGITTSLGGIAETGSVILVPSPMEPRLLSLAMPVHLAVVESARLFPTLLDFMESGEYQAEVPSNLVLVSGASRTADIELTLAIGVHGPKTFLVALIG